MAATPKTLTIFGAGKLAVVLAQLALKAGYKVCIAGSGSPDKIKLSMQILAPGAEVAKHEDAAKFSEVILLALPLGKYQNLPVTALNGKLVIDAMNYWWEVDGKRGDLQNPVTSTSELVQTFLRGARVVKAFSHMGYHHLSDGAKPSGAVGRKAIAIAGDNQADNTVVATIVNDLGFDPFIIGRLSAGKQLEPGHSAFGANVDIQTLKSMLKA